MFALKQAKKNTEFLKTFIINFLKSLVKRILIKTKNNKRILDVNEVHSRMHSTFFKYILYNSLERRTHGRMRNSLNIH